MRQERVDRWIDMVVPEIKAVQDQDPPNATLDVQTGELKMTGRPYTAEDVPHMLAVLDEVNALKDELVEDAFQLVSQLRFVRSMRITDTDLIAWFRQYLAKDRREAAVWGKEYDTAKKLLDF